MCDIWKGNSNLKQLTEDDVKGLLGTLKRFGTKQVVMSGGEALLNTNFFRLCELLQNEGIRIALLSTGLLFRKNTDSLVNLVDTVIVSLDGDQTTHDAIRAIPGGFAKLKDGIQYVKSIKPGYKISARTVICRLNFKIWPNIIDTAKEIGLSQISFLPADVTSEAFNRDIPWDAFWQEGIMLSLKELPLLDNVINELIENYKIEFATGFIAEAPGKIRKIYDYYSALHGLSPFPYKKCNAPWVSTVIEADGAVRPCFFHETIGNIKDNSLDEILNSSQAVQFRKNLDVSKDSTCVKCVCYLNLNPLTNPF